MKLPGRFFERDENLIVAMGLIGGIAVALTALAVFAYVIPETETETETLARYEHTGRYTYTVDTDPSALNPSETIGPVQPGTTEDGDELPPAIFTRLAKALHFLYVYQLQGASQVSGTVSAELEIKAGTSWSQRVPLVEAVPFEGATGGIEGTVDFKQIAALLTQIEEQTGVTTGSVDLTVIPEVDVQATSNSQQFSETYSSPLTFTYNSNLITPDETLAFSEPGTITSTIERDKELTLFGGSVMVGTVRDFAAPLAVVALALTGVFASIYFLGIGRSETAMVRTRYGSLLVPVAEVESAASHRISVASLLDLAQLAKREGRSLFVRDFDNGAQAYLLHDGMVIYQYAVGDVPQGWIRSPGVTASVEPAVVAPAASASPQEEPASAPDASIAMLEAQVEAPAAPEVIQEQPPLPVEVVEEPPLSLDAVVEEQPTAPVPVVEPVEEPVETFDVESIPAWLMEPYQYDEPKEVAPPNSNGLAHESQAVPAGVSEPDAASGDSEASSNGHDEDGGTLETVPAADDEPIAEAGEPLSNGFTDLVWKRPSESERDTAIVETSPETESTNATVEASSKAQEEQTVTDVEESQEAEAEVVAVETEAPLETEAEPAIAADETLAEAESAPSMETAASTVESHAITAEPAKGRSPRLAVRRWLRNRSGGPLLEDEHTHESNVSEGPSADAAAGLALTADTASDEPAGLPEDLQAWSAPATENDSDIEQAVVETPAAESTAQKPPQDPEPVDDLALGPVEDQPAATQTDAEEVVAALEADTQPVEKLDVKIFGPGEQSAPLAADEGASTEETSPAQTYEAVVAFQPASETPSETEEAVAALEKEAQPAEELEVKTFDPTGEDVAVAALDHDMTEEAAVTASRPRARRQPLEKKLTGYARRWLRDFLDYQPEERPEKQ